jgi:N-acetyl-gamma-glutamyl-phosphate/LysW-gamma-L-alpha-aminoadipyl-6-phosphate reductase
VLTAAVVGAAGYAGGELLRLLLDHPAVESTQATSERLAGRPVSAMHPNLRDRTRLKLRRREDLDPTDVLFLCLPPGEAAGSMDDFASLAGTVVDLSPDFRLRDPALHAAWYGADTVCPRWRRRFVYGLPETGRRELVGARFLSGVGCNATAVNLALLPLAKAGWIERAVVEVKVGSSEAGARATGSSHHPERAGAVRSYAPVGHRHQAEILQALDLEPRRLSFSATAIDRVRGVLATAHIFLTCDPDERAIHRLFRDAYRDEPFVRRVRERRGLYRYPEPKIVQGTNYCDVGWALDREGGRLVVIAALDNLVKGAAGSAVQAVNVAHDLGETAGLGFPGLHPI